jgi:hypothetical protein
MKHGKTEGYERAKGILVEKSITYKQMKRIKNWFDKFEGEWDDPEFKLNGGKTMMNWVNNTLDTATSAIKNIKDAQKDAGTAIKNTHQKDGYTKDNNKVTFKTTIPTTPNFAKDISGQIERGKPIYEPMGMSEEIVRMKELIIYESKI